VNEKASVKILLANDRGLLEEGVRAVILDTIAGGDLSDAELVSRCVREPEKLRLAVESERATATTLVVLLLDPLGTAWLDVADEIRSDDHVAVLVLVARPNYAVQRMWRRRTATGRYRATGMLALNSGGGDLLGALKAAASNTAESGYWLERDGDDMPIARHPTALLAAVPDDVAAAITHIQRRRLLHKALVLSSRLPRDEVLAQLNVADGTYTGQKKELKTLLGVDTDMQLIFKAYEYGLIGEAGPEWSERGE